MYSAAWVTVNVRCSHVTNKFNEIVLFFLAKDTFFCIDLIMSLLLCMVTCNSNITTKTLMVFILLNTGWWDPSNDKVIFLYMLSLVSFNHIHTPTGDLDKVQTHLQKSRKGTALHLQEISVFLSHIHDCVPWIMLWVKNKSLVPGIQFSLI